MGNKGLLIIIAVVFVGVLGVLLVQTLQEPDTTSEQVANALEDMSAEIDTN